jgi:DNA-binding response OmpR family regulator
MMRILLIHPDNIQRELLQFLLSKAGYDVEPVRTLARAQQELLADKSAGLIALEETMRDHLYRLCAELRRNKFDGPIIVLAGDADIDDELRAFESGADDYISSPFDPTVLMSRLGSVVRRLRTPIPFAEVARQDVSPNL